MTPYIAYTRSHGAYSVVIDLGVFGCDWVVNMGLSWAAERRRSGDDLKFGSMILSDILMNL